VELALPVVNRQRGIVQAGRHLVKKAAHELERKRLATTKDKQQIYQRLVLAHRRAILLRHEVSPKVRSTYEAVRDGYRIGRFGYLDLLDAQAARFDVEERALEAVVAYHRTFIELMGATGLRLPTQLFGRPSTAPGE
jgi:cobalt-zinc-cadmium efflux system outer membrane protein